MEQAVEYVKQAVQEDNAGNYAKAFPLYKNTLECIMTLLEHEKNPKIKEAITQKFNEYMRRAEEIRAVLDEGSSGPGPAANGDAAVAARPKTKGKDGAGGGEGEDGEQAKLREKPNVKWNDVAGLESAKQPLLAKSEKNQSHIRKYCTSRSENPFGKFSPDSATYRSKFVLVCNSQYWITTQGLASGHILISI